MQKTQIVVRAERRAERSRSTENGRVKINV